MSHSKPVVNLSQVQRVLNSQFGQPIVNLSAAEVNGNFSSVFFFEHAGLEYVIRFGQADADYRKEQRIADMLASQGVPYPRIVAVGEEDRYLYAISERVQGNIVADLGSEQKSAILPDLIRSISHMNQIHLGNTTGYGWLTNDGNGTYATWSAAVEGMFANRQPGSFWDNWMALFETSCMERKVFEELYPRLIAYSNYNAPHRHFVHNDCHQWNILSDGRRITGIIDSNAWYGDFLIDIATIEDAIPGQDVADAFRRHYDALGKPVEHFAERLRGARYLKGIDALRFYAKMGWDHAYVELRDRLLRLE
jgi:hygromycin-B 4-O-kinase